MAALLAFETITYPDILKWIGTFPSLADGRETGPSAHGKKSLELTYDAAALSGRHEVFELDEGLTLFICEQHIKDDLLLHCVGQPSITFAFRLSGETIDMFNGLGEVRRSGPGCSIAVHHDVIQWERTVPGGTFFDALFITLTQTAVERLLGAPIGEIDEQLSFEGSPSGSIRTHSIALSNDMVAIVQAIKHRTGIAAIETAFITAKVQELACLAINDLVRERNRTVIPATLHPRHVPALQRARAILEAEYAEHHPLEVLARRVGLSRTNLAVGFKAFYGRTVGEHLTERRMAVAVEMLRAADATIARVAPSVGYDSPYSFSRAFKRHFGVAPRGFDRLFN